MAVDNPLQDDLAGDVAHGGPSLDGAPLSTDLVAGGGGVSGTREDTGPTGLLNRSWVSLSDIKQPPPPSETPIRDVARNFLAGVGRGVTALADDPGQIVKYPLTVAGSTAYDWLAPKFGGSRLTQEQRQDLGLRPVPPEQQGDLASIAAAIPGPNPYNVIPKTETEARAATLGQGAYTGALLGAMGPLGATVGGLLGGAGSLTGQEVAKYVPEWLQPFTELGVNALIQGGGGYLRSRPGAAIDPAAADIARTGRAEDIPFSAPDITPGSRFRTPAQVQNTSDALQGNMIRELGLDPNTGDPVTTNRVTPDVVRIGKGNAGTDMNAISNANDIGPGQNLRLLQQLQNAENTIDTTAGITDADRQQMRQRIGEIRRAIDMNTGVMKGPDYADLTAVDSPLDRLAGNDNSAMARIGRGLMTNLDNAFRSSLSNDDQAAFSNAKYRYRLASTLDPLADRYQGRTLPMNEVADQLYTTQQKYGTTPGSQLDRFMSQASLIAGGPTPYAPSVVRSVLENPMPAAMSAATGSVGPVVGQFAGPIMDYLLGGAARRSGRTEDVIAAVTNPVRGQPDFLGTFNRERLRNALAGLAAASAP